MINLFSKNRAPLAILAICLAVMLSGCNGGGAAQAPSGSGEGDTLEGATDALLSDIVKAADGQLPESSRMGASSERAIEADESQYMLGLSTDDFGKYVTEASASTGMLSTQAHEIALVKCKDAAAAGEVKKLVANGFDPGKWICVRPEKALVADSGSYVLLAVSNSAFADAAAKSFAEAAKDNVGEVVTFYDGE
ncbi:MAG: DUF4358 domain-containing protein [Clostridiales Family XIII bacterium]|jgi:hypothetical protein|nr:DUF4358 domain-containing protein [Clostridiales Family XIII bacterium]